VYKTTQSYSIRQRGEAWFSLALQQAVIWFCSSSSSPNTVSARLECARCASRGCQWRCLGACIRDGLL